MSPLIAPTSIRTCALRRSDCLTALSQIDRVMTEALDEARQQAKARCVDAFRDLLAPFDLARHEVLIDARGGETYLSLKFRGDARAPMPLEGLCGDGLLLDVLQEIDDFLHCHEDWLDCLDGATLTYGIGSRQ